MAEILISLTIIGVIAAITLPSLRANINESAWATQRKALYSRMSQAISMMPSLNGYGIVMNSDGTINYTETNSKAAMVFVTDGLNKVLKINNICDSTNLNKCGLPDRIIPMPDIWTHRISKINFPIKLSDLNPLFTDSFTDGSGYTFINPQKNINTDATAIETNNGESIAVFYNPLCQANMGETDIHFPQTKMCVNFVYDLNGKKGPNKVGKDIGFITALYSTDSNIVAPMPLEKYSGYNIQTVAVSLCKNKDKDTRLPNIDELSSIFYNDQLTGNAAHNIFWSSSLTNDNKAWEQNFAAGYRKTGSRTVGSQYIRCIKR